MNQIRPARYEDKDAFLQLWNRSFHDSENFRNWLFENRFIPDYSVCMEEDGKIVSEAQSLPCHIRIRNAVFRGAIMVGACTDPAYGGRGYMKALYTYYMNMVRDMGIAVCPHTPAVLKTYFSVGHYTVSDTAFLTASHAVNCPDCPEMEEIDLQGNNLSGIFYCYSQFSLRYSGIMDRSMADFMLKCRDYASDGGKCAVYKSGGVVLGYCIYYDTDEQFHAEEVISQDQESEQALVHWILKQADGKKARIKLPPDTQVSAEGALLTIQPRNVLGIANVQTLLRTLGGQQEDLVIAIEDKIVPQNNGHFNLKGERTEKRAHAAMDAGHFGQWMTGYKTLFELEENKDAEIFDLEAGRQLNKMFPKCACHIVDEY